MSTTIINSKDGVVIAGDNYLELPKGPASARPTDIRTGMIRYNYDWDTNNRGLQVAIGTADATGKPDVVEWRGVAVTDPVTGKIESSALPSYILGSASYQGTWNAATNNPPIGAPGAAGRYFIVSVAGNGAGAPSLVPADVAAGYKVGDWVVSTGALWDRIDYNATTTTATAVEMSDVGLRDKHNIKGVTILQTGIQCIVESALDRISGDTVEGTIVFNNASASAYLRLKSGSAALPGVSFSTDTNTGLFAPAADTLGFTAGGTQISTFNTAAASFYKPVFGINGLASTPSYAFTSATNTGLYYTGTGIGFSVNGVNKMSINTDYSELTTVRIDDGTAITPSLSFKSNTNTGMYRVGTDTIGFSTKGTRSLAIGPTSTVFDTKIAVPVGTSLLPSIIFNGDENTGIFQSASDHLNISTNGVQRVDISNASILLGVPLVSQGGTALLPSITFTGDENTGIFKPGNEIIAFSNNGVESIRFTTDNIQISKPVFATTGSIDVPSYSFTNDTTTGMYSISDGTIGFSTNGVRAFSISSAGVVSTTSMIVPSGNQTSPGLAFSDNTDTGLFSSNTTSMGITVDKVSRLEVSTTEISAKLQLQVLGGTPALPGIAISGDTNTGIYSSAADNIGITAGGVAILGCSPTTVLVNKPISILRGTATAPSYSFAGDTTVGVFSPSASQVALSVNGAKLTATASSLIATVPVYAADGTAAAPSYTFASDPSIGMYRVNTEQLGFSVNSKNMMTITESQIGMYTAINMGIANPIIWNGSIAGRTALVKTDNDGSSLRFEASNASEPFKFGSAFETFMTVHPRALVLPVGTAAQVQTTVNGMIRYDSADNKFYGCRNAVWIELGADTVATANNALKFDNKTYVQAKTDIRSGLLTASDTIANATNAGNAAKFDNKTYQQVYDAVRVGLVTTDGSIATAEYAKTAGTATSATTATTANNALAFNGKTYAQAYADIRSGLVPSSGKVDDSLKLDGKTYAQVISNARSGLLLATGTAVDSSKFNGLTYAQVKADILTGTASNANALGGKTYAQVVSGARSGVLLSNGTGASLTLTNRLTLPAAGSGPSVFVGAASTDNDMINGLHSATSHVTLLNGSVRISADAFGNPHLIINPNQVIAPGSIDAKGEITAFVPSDLRIKKNVVAIENASDKVCKLGGYSYEYISDEYKQGTQYGLIAQNVEEIMPELVEEHNGIKRIKTGDYALVGLLAQAHKEQATKISQLEHDINELKALVQLLLTK